MFWDVREPPEFYPDVFGGICFDQLYPHGARRSSRRGEPESIFLLTNLAALVAMTIFAFVLR